MISVIITAYNRESSIREAIKSVCSQDYEDFELIVVDDGSEDKTLDIIKSLAAEDARIKVVAAEHGGVAAARNAGLAAASGEYITYLDSDDRYYPGALKIMAEEIGDADVLIYDAKEVFPDGHENYFGSFHDGLSDTGAGALSIELAILSKPCPWNHLIKKEVYEVVRTELGEVFPTGYYYEDFGALPLLMKNTCKANYIATPLVAYIQSASSVMRVSGYNERYDDVFPMTDRVRKGLGKQYEAEAEYLAFDHLLVAGAKRYLECSRFDMATKCVDYMKENYPNWKKNKYVAAEPAKKKLLATLIYGRHYKLLKLLGK